MKVLVTGSHGYIGSVLLPYLEENGFDVIGYDPGFFKDCILKENGNGKLIQKDAREITKENLKDIDAVIHLAGISNDPLKKLTPEKVYHPTREYSLKIAKLCKETGTKFIFASSCSVYGAGGNKILDEKSEPNPQTPYSVNKLEIEQDLQELSDKNFSPIALRFSTLYGFSPRMRFDIVINMLTGMALTKKEIILNSDGKAWRPMLHIKDACKAIVYSLKSNYHEPKLLILNVGDSNQNYQIIQMVEVIKKEIPGTKVSFLTKKEEFTSDTELIKDRKVQDGVDTRTYTVSFEKIKQVFPGFKCDYTIEKGVKELVQKLRELNITEEDFKNKNFYRLQKMEDLFEKGKLTENLTWKSEMERVDTQNLYLKQVKVEDITPTYIEALNDQEIVGLTEARHQTWNEESVRKYVEESTKEGESLLIGIYLKENNAHIGNIRLSGFDDKHKRVELGIMLFDRAEWGKGYASEALETVKNFVFNTLKYHKLCADYYSINKASAKLFEKAGFEIQGTFKDHFLIDKQYVDSIRVAVIKNEN